MLMFVIVVVVLVAGLAALVLSRPNHFHIERKATVAAPPQRVYDLIASFQNWRAWSPWEDVDPDLKRDYQGPDSGVGAVYAWSGNNRAGVGRMEVVETDAPSKVKIDLQFIKPFAARNTAMFTIAPSADGSEVTWAMYGPNSLMGKAMSLVFGMEKMIGPSFEQGLAKMKAAAEK